MEKENNKARSEKKRTLASRSELTKETLCGCAGFMGPMYTRKNNREMAGPSPGEASYDALS